MTDPSHPWRYPVLGTAPLALRSVVLRRVEGAAERLTFYSDARAEKVRALQRDPSFALLFWNAASGLQLRLTGRATVERAPEAVAADWARARASHALYATALPPGAPIEAPDAVARTPEAHFAVIHAVPLHLDLLALDGAAILPGTPSVAGQHVRIQASRQGSGPLAGWEGGYVVP